MGVSISIIMPTHNRAELLDTVLRSLSLIEVPDEADVDLVLVANACSDNTIEVASKWARSLPFPTKCVEESKPNVCVARNAGIQASRGEIIALLDDDVWVEPGWLKGLLEVFASTPADIVAGRVELWWGETPKPDWFTARLEAMLSQIDHGDQVVELRRRGDAVGANLSWRRALTDAIGGFTPGLDRTGTRLLGGGDTELIQRALARGSRMFYAPRAIAHHYVSPGRCTAEYLARLSRDQATSRVYIDPSPTWCRMAIKVVSGLRQWLSHLVSEQWYALSGDQGQAVYHRARKNAGIGKMVGAYERLLRRTAVDRFASSR